MCRNNAVKKELLLTFSMVALTLILLHGSTNTLAAFCLADIDNDGRVHYSDLIILNAEMGRNNCSVTPCRADLNDDGKVTSIDNEILENEFGRSDCSSRKGDRQVLKQKQDNTSDDGSTLPEKERTPADTVVDENVEDGTSPLMTKFKDNEDGTVTDPTTGLVWTKEANLRGDTVLFHQAINYINGMNEGKHQNFGYTDWRLPTLKEVRSLIEYKELTSKGHELPAGHPFQNVQSLRFYDRSSPSYLTRPVHAWLVYAYCSIVGHNVESCFGFVWPVRGE